MVYNDFRVGASSLRLNTLVTVLLNSDFFSCFFPSRHRSTWRVRVFWAWRSTVAKNQRKQSLKHLCAWKLPCSSKVSHPPLEFRGTMLQAQGPDDPSRCFVILPFILGTLPVFLLMISPTPLDSGICHYRRRWRRRRKPKRQKRHQSHVGGHTGGLSTYLGFSDSREGWLVSGK